MSPVIIGVDPHKRSATIEIVDGRERTLGQGRFSTDNDGYQRMLAEGRRRPGVWGTLERKPALSTDHAGQAATSLPTKIDL